MFRKTSNRSLKKGNQEIVLKKRTRCSIESSEDLVRIRTMGCSNAGLDKKAMNGHRPSGQIAIAPTGIFQMVLVTGDASIGSLLNNGNYGN